MKILRLVFFSTVIFMVLGCNLQLSESSEHKTAQFTFKNFLSQNNIQKLSDGQYLYEGDIVFGEDQLKTLYYNSLKNEDTDNKGNIAVSSSGTRLIWHNNEQLCLTYSFTTNMATASFSDSEVKNALREAMNIWSSVADVQFVEVSSSPLFNVRTVYVNDNYVAIAFFPHGVYEYNLDINLKYIDHLYTTYPRMVGLLTHELGHVLGLAHEHQRAEAPYDYNGGVFGEAFGPYDSESIMSYSNIPYTDGLSAGDLNLIRYLYPKRVGVLTTSGRVNVKEGLLNASWAELATSIKQIDISGNRVGVLTTSGVVYVKEGSLGAPWQQLSNSVTQFDLSGNRIGIVTTTGSTYVKEGSLDASWQKISNSTQQIVLSGNRVGILTTSGKAYIKEGSLSASWQYMGTGIQQIVLSGNRVGILTTSGNAYVKEGTLSASVQNLETDVQQISLSVNRIGVLKTNGRVYIKEGVLSASWQNIAKSVQQIDLSGNRVGLLLASGGAYVIEGSLNAGWQNIATGIEQLKL